MKYLISVIFDTLEFLKSTDKHDCVKVGREKFDKMLMLIF